MQPRIHALTLAVDDLDRALAFYRDGLGFESTGIIGTEFPGDEVNAAGRVAMFELQGGLILSLWPRSELAKDAKVPLGSPKSGEFSIGHAVTSTDAVDSLLEQAGKAGATVDQAQDRAWGIYSGHFRDLDGHLWEVMWNPQIDSELVD